MLLSERILAAMLAVSILSACSSGNKIPKLMTDQIVFSLEKGSCYGNCSVYNFYIDKKGNAFFEGVANTEKLGKFYKKLNDTVYQNFYREFSLSQFDTLRSVYPSEIADFPSITVGFRSAKNLKKVTYKESRPAVLRKLQLQLESVANSRTGWQTTEKAKAPAAKKQEASAQVQEIEDKTQIIIEPVEGLMLPRWFKKYEIYELSLVRKVAPNLNYWLVIWNKDKISAEDMISLLQQDRDIKKAEFNKKIVPREH